MINKMSDLIGKINHNIDSDTRRIIAINIVRASVKYDIPVEYLFAIIWTESTFNPYAYNKKTECIGLMQINPRVWLDKDTKELRDMLFIIPVNIDAGAYILRYYYDQYHSWHKAIIAYYGLSEYAEKHYKKIVLKRVNKIRKEVKKTS